MIASSSFTIRSQVTARREGGDVATLGDRQIEVTRAAGRLALADVEPEIVFDPRDVTGANLSEEMTADQDIEAVRTLLAYEMAGANRTTAVESLMRRLRELQ
jgi:hypothetical protein